MVTRPGGGTLACGATYLRSATAYTSSICNRRWGLITDAYRAMVELSAAGGKVLFVGTKKQAQDVIASEAEGVGHWYVNQRWLGGTLTNFQTIKARIDYMKGLQEQRDSGYLNRLPKKETVRLTHTLDKLEKYFTGLRDMDRLRMRFS